MAPNGHTASGRRGARKSRDAQSSSWLDKHGFEEYEAWKEANPDTRLPYDDWKHSNQHVSGLSLYYNTLRIFEESDSSDENGQAVKAKSQPTKPRGQIGRPRKSATINGHGQPRSAGTATPSKAANREESSPSAKKKRKARKKPLSEEIIASASDSDDAAKDPEISTSGAEMATPAAPTITITLNGKRKSSTRKARKKPISEETVSPEDELDDPMDITIDEVTNSAIASPLPVRPAPKSPATAPTANPPRKSHILKLSTRKTPKKPENSEETVSGVTGEANASSTQATPSTVGKASQPKITINTNPTPKSNADPDSAAASPASASAPGSTRRGLRTRKPAQQRPYYHDSQLFEDVEPRNGDAHEENMSSPVAQASLDEEAMALLQEEAESEPSKPKHFKGKGRAWKKEGSDEDEDYLLAAKKKAAKTAKTKAKGQVPKKRGRPKKSGRSEELVGEETDEDKENVKRKRHMPRKSALSEEIIQDSSDGGEEDKEMRDGREGEKAEPESKQDDKQEDKVDTEGGRQEDGHGDGQEEAEERKELAEETGIAEETRAVEEAIVMEENITEEDKRPEEEAKSNEAEADKTEESKEAVVDEAKADQDDNTKAEQEEPAKETEAEKDEKEAPQHKAAVSTNQDDKTPERPEPQQNQENNNASPAPVSPPNRSWTPEGLPNPPLVAASTPENESPPAPYGQHDVPSPFYKAD